MITPMGPIFTLYGSDKDTHHSYGPVYDSLYPTEESRLAVRRVMEIGIASGQALLAFLEIFPNAEIVGLDKEPCHRREVGSTDPNIYPLTPRPPRLEIHQGDMRIYADLMRAVNGRQFDLIVEDATHELDDNLRTLFWLYPFLSDGGRYIVEEFANVGAYLPNMKLFYSAHVRETGPPHAGEYLLVVRG